MSGILLGALAIIAGLIFCFRGYLALRTVIAIWGAFVGFALGSGLASAATGDPPLTGVIGWSAAATFGWIALAAPPGESPQLQTLNILLAAAGAGAGIFSWLRLRQGC